MHNPLIYIILLTAGLWPQSNPWKEKFISAMNDPRGVSITVEIEQKQFDTNSVERGTIEIVKRIIISWIHHLKQWLLWGIRFKHGINNQINSS